MWTNLKHVGIIAALGLGQVAGQLEPLLTGASIFWNATIDPSNPSNSPDVKYGNGVFLTPDGSKLVVTSEGGTVTCYDAMTGAFEWEYSPPDVGTIVRSHSGISFTTANAASPYMVYAITDNENSLNSRNRVIAIDADGNELWVSPQLEGIAKGTPVISDDGGYVFLTHNAEFNSIGYFSALDAMMGGEVLYSAGNVTTPFGPVGIFHKPAEGFYDGDFGRDNTNDIMMWAVTPVEDGITIGDGATFAFQFPKTFNGTATEDVGYFKLGETPRPFMTNTAPSITNEGRSAYWSHSRSAWTAWVADQPLARFYFNRDRNVISGFTRNSDWPGQPCFASPAFSSDPNQPAVFGGSAFQEFVRTSHNFGDVIIQPTDSLIMAKAIVDPEDRAVYYAEENGIVHQAGFEDISNIWTFDIGGAIEGEIALSPKADILYVASTDGTITALQVADIPPTLAPSSIPSDAPSDVPTMAPVVPTDPPTTSPTAATDSPTPSPTAAPVVTTAAPTEDEMTAVTSAPTESATEPDGGSGDGDGESSAPQKMLFTVFASIVALLFL